MAVRVGNIQLFVGITAILVCLCDGQLDSKPVCTYDINQAALGCQLDILIMSDILKDPLDGQTNREDFCRNRFEQCVKAVQSGTDHQCEGVDVKEEMHHARVNALRGFCREIDVWQKYKGCLQAQLLDAIAVCQREHYLNKQNFTRTEFSGMYKSEFDRRNARCGVQRSFQVCTENVIYANCRDYYFYFKDYQVALLTPYCRQLYDLTSRYVTDDPNKGATPGSSILRVALVAAATCITSKIAL
ncbi:uncharacterized protein LOC135464200 [Liolophura sinensis]|uniref:uncharacterized protein LOC135464200 n=1 Tax=Liolophura sinensis TaxID=3198878 RepID=UPI003159397A